MNQNAVIEIAQVANGFIVRPTFDWITGGSGHPRSWYGASEEYQVFRTMSELIAFLSQHFSHRAQSIQVDPAVSTKEVS